MPTPAERDLKPTPEAEAIYRRWLAHLDDELTRHTTPDRRSEIVRDELFQIFLGRPHGGKINATLDSELATSVLAESFDPRNITLAAEYDPACDREQFAPRKPLIYLWQMFDRSALGANLWLGLRFRCMIGRHLFRHVGKGVRIHPDVTFTFGYNLIFDDGCTVLEGAFLDDRTPLTLQARTTVPRFATIDAASLPG